MEQNRYIAAIDLGTSKIALCIATIDDKNADIVFYKECPSNGISRSSIQNVKNTTAALEGLIKCAENELGIKITQAVVGLPKYYIRQETKSAEMTLDDNKEITKEEVKALMDMAKQKVIINDGSIESIYGAIAQSYSDGEDFQVSEMEIIGRYSNHLEGNFKIMIGKKNYLTNIENVFSKLSICPIRRYFTADSTAEAVLNRAEMENGVALVDLGGGATSVAVYQGSILRHYASIPFGGLNITLDIKQECAISQELAENIKKGFGICMPEKLQNMSEKVLQVCGDGPDPDTQIPVKYLSEIITARMQEIIDAVLYEIQQSGFADKIRSGIVITGGGVELGNCTTMFQEMSGYNIRTGYPKNKFATSCSGIKDVSAAVCAGLILSAKEEHNLNCATQAEESVGTAPLKIETKHDGTLPFNEIPEEEIKEKTRQPYEKLPRKEPGRSFWGGIRKAGTKPPSPQETGSRLVQGGKEILKGLFDEFEKA